ncbi:MAG: phospholipase D-like domain-containing protein, partial [Clostridia bacterium]
MTETNVSEQYKQNFNSDKFFSDEKSAERVVLLDDGKDSFLRRIEIIEQAKDRILLTSHNVTYSEQTQLLFTALICAADRGVKISIIFDGLFGDMRIGKGRDLVNILLSCPSVEYYVYNRFDIFAPQNINTRLHDKMLVVDNSFILFGGRNIGSKYYEFDAGYNYKDRDCLVINTDTEPTTVFGDLTNYFNSLKNASNQRLPLKTLARKLLQKKNLLLEKYSSYLSLAKANFYKDYNTTGVAVNKISLITNPTQMGKKEPHIAYTLARLAEREGTIMFQTPYAVISKQNIKILSDLTKKASVTMFTNSLATASNYFANPYYEANKQNLLDAGMSIYEYQNTSNALHGKTYLIGDRLVAIGSFNLDERSMYIDTESMLVIDGASFY